MLRIALGSVLYLLGGLTAAMEAFNLYLVFSGSDRTFNVNTLRAGEMLGMHRLDIVLGPYLHSHVILVVLTVLLLIAGSRLVKT